MTVEKTFQGKRRGPLAAIRAFCMWCCGGQWSEVAACQSVNCHFLQYRRGVIPPGAGRSLVRIIKGRCLDCMPDGPANCDAFQAYEIHPPCPCWPFRMGRNPNIGKEQREKHRAHGKRLMNFTGGHAVSASQTAPMGQG